MLKEGAKFLAAQASKTSDGDEEKGKEATFGPDTTQVARLKSKSTTSSSNGTVPTFISWLF